MNLFDPGGADILYFISMVLLTDIARNLQLNLSKIEPALVARPLKIDLMLKVRKIIKTFNLKKFGKKNFLVSLFLNYSLKSIFFQKLAILEL